MPSVEMALMIKHYSYYVLYAIFHMFFLMIFHCCVWNVKFEFWLHFMFHIFFLDFLTVIKIIFQFCSKYVCVNIL